MDNSVNANNYFSTLTSEMARIDADRASWRQALAQTDILAKQMRELSQINSASEEITRTMKALQSPAMTIAQQYQDQLSANSAAMHAIKAWQDAERVQSEQMRRMLDPLDGGLLADDVTKKFIKELTAAGSIHDHIKQLVDQTSGIGSVAQMLALQADESREQHRRLLDNVTGASSIQSYLKEFEAINKQWMVPSEVLGIVGSFREIQDQLGRASLPTINWGSAGALAKILGSEGIQEQLSLLGIGPDGAMQLPDEIPERGILSRKQSDAVALVSLLLSILFFIYQENQQDKAKTEAFQTQTTSTLQVQSQQIQNLTVLIGQALAKAAIQPEERFVVRERPATVRAEPEHGSPVQGKLLPNEVVRALERKGRWAEIEYYHWLHEEYRTGWVLKHYLERVPASYSKK